MEGCPVLNALAGAIVNPGCCYEHIVFTTKNPCISKISHGMQGDYYRVPMPSLLPCIFPSAWGDNERKLCFFFFGAIDLSRVYKKLYCKTSSDGSLGMLH